LQPPIRLVVGSKLEGAREKLLRQCDPVWIVGSALSGAVVQQQARAKEAIFGEAGVFALSRRSRRGYSNEVTQGKAAMPHDVFISYSSHDKPVADAVCATLEGMKIRCWIAPRDVVPGANYAEALIDAINASRVLVLIFSGKSNQSSQVMRELERAISKGVTIIPFRIEEVPLSKAMEYFISTPHWLDAMSPPLERHIVRLGETIRLLLGGAPPEPAAVADSPGSVNPPATRSRGRPGRWIVAGALGLVLLAGFLTPVLKRRWQPVRTDPPSTNQTVTAPAVGTQAPTNPAINAPLVATSRPPVEPSSGKATSQPIVAVFPTVRPPPADDALVKLVPLKAALAEQLGRSAWAEAEATVASIRALKPRDLEAMDALAAIHRQQGVGEIKRIETTARLFATAVSPDGLLVGVAGENGLCWLWDQNLTNAVRPLLGIRSDIRALAFIADGRLLLAAAWDNVIYALDVASGRITQRLEGHQKGVSGLAVAGTRVFSSSWDGSLRVWGLNNGNTLRSLTPQPDDYEAFAVAVSRDGRFVAARFQNSFRVFEVEEGSQIASIPGGREGYRWGHSDGLAFGADGSQLIVGQQKELRIYSVSQAGTRESGRLIGHGEHITGVCVSPEGSRVLSSSEDGTLRLWDLRNGLELASFGHAGVVASGIFAPDGSTVYSVGWDKTARCWRLPKVSTNVPAPLAGPGVTIQTNAQSADADLPRLKSRLSEQLRQEVHAEAARTASAILALQPDDLEARDALALGDQAQGVGEIASYRNGKSGVTAVGCSSDYVAWGDDDGIVSLCELKSGRVVHRFTGHTNLIESAQFSPDGRFLLSGSRDSSMRLWDVVSRREVRRFDGHAHKVSSVVFHPDGRRVVSASFDQTIRVWSRATGQELDQIGTKVKERLKETGRWTYQMTLSRDGNQAATAHDEGVALWDLRQGTRLQFFQTTTLPWGIGHESARIVRAVALTPDGRQLLAGYAKGGLLVWDIASGQELHALAGHTKQVNALAVSPDGRRALSGSDDGTVRLWELASGRERCRFTAHRLAVNGVVFSADGREAFSAGSDQTVRRWRLPE
jgi:WD40 repeat protein